MRLTRKHWLIILITPSVFLLDQITKLIIHSTLKPYGQIVLIPRVIEFIFVKNYGLVFGMFSDRLGSSSAWIFLGISLIALGIIIHLFFRTDNQAVLLPTALSLVLAGAFGNLIDRFRWGYVVDFIQILFNYKGWTWPTFNVADIAITIGIILLIIDSFRPQPKDQVRGLEKK